MELQANNFDNMITIFVYLKIPEVTSLVRLQFDNRSTGFRKTVNTDVLCIIDLNHMQLTTSEAEQIISLDSVM